MKLYLYHTMTDKYIKTMTDKNVLTNNVLLRDKMSDM
jgi:hypothetical protein